MRPRYLPTVSSKHLDAIVHSTLSTVDAMLADADIVHYHAVGPGLPAVLPRYLSGAKVVLTVHGLDAERAKWSRSAQLVLRFGQWMSARVPDATIVVSRDLAEHFRKRYDRTTWHVPNGVGDPIHRPPDGIRRRFGLRGGDYILFVGRLVPEKAPDLLLRAFSAIDGETKLVLAGGSSFTDDYVRGLRSQAASDPRVILPGYVYGDLLEELYSNAAVFVLPSLLEGLPLTLLEAASYRIPVIASDIPPHIEIIGSDGPGRRLVAAGDDGGLSRALAHALGTQSAERAGADAFGREVLSTYRWDEVADATEEVYRAVTRRSRGT